MHWTSKTCWGALALLAVSTSGANQGNEQAQSPTVALMGKRVSAQFKEASLSQVTEWLSSHGLSYVMKIEPGDARMTLNIVDQPLKDAAAAIAHAMGGKWVQNGNVLTFVKGGGYAFLGDNVKVPPAAELKGYRFDGQSMMPLTEKELKEFKDGFKFNEPFTEKDAKLFKEKIEKELEFKLADPGAMKEFKERFAKRLKPLNEQELKAFKFKGGDLLPMDRDLEAAMDSVTQKQWELHERQGFLKWSDLDQKQHKLLGNPKADVNVNLTVTIDGKTLNVRGK